jgi:DNA-directed RNA polymerase subunit omega
MIDPSDGTRRYSGTIGGTATHRDKRQPHFGTKPTLSITGPALGLEEPKVHRQRVAGHGIPGASRRCRKRRNFSIAFAERTFNLTGSTETERTHLNSEFCRQALAKVGNPNVLINLISRRVRQLNSGGGGLSRPLLNDTAGLGAADIALAEIIEDKMGWEMPEDLQLLEPPPKKRKKS